LHGKLLSLILYGMVYKRKKNHYILLELVLAFSLLALFVGPLLQAPFSHVRKQIQSIATLRLSLQAQTLLTEVEEKICKNEISWKKIEQSQKSPVLLDSKKIDPLTLTYSNTPTYEAKIWLSKAHLEKKEDQSSYGWVKATIVFSSLVKPQEKPSRFSSTFFITKRPKQLSIQTPPIEE
jgi:hypothetical protein